MIASPHTVGRGSPRSAPCRCEPRPTCSEMRSIENTTPNARINTSKAANNTGRAQSALRCGVTGAARWVQRACFTACVFTMALTNVALAQDNLPPVSSARAVALFEAICGTNLPNFKNAVRTAKANGVSYKADTGTLYSTKEDLSVKVFGGPGAGRTCSVVFVSKDSRSKFLKAASQLSPNGELFTSRSQSGQKTTASLYQGKALFIVDGPTRGGGKKYYNLRMLSQR